MISRYQKGLKMKVRVIYGSLIFLAMSLFNYALADTVVEKNNVTKIKVKITNLIDFISNNDFEKINTSKNELVLILKTSEVSIDVLILAIKKHHFNPRIYTQLMSLLTTNTSSTLETKGYELAVSFNRIEKLIGLEILSESLISTKQTLELTSEIICNSQDVEVVKAAIILFPNLTQSKSRTSEIIDCFKRALMFDDISIQSESLFKISKLTMNKNDLLLVMSFLNKPEHDLKMSAALAIEKTVIFDQSVKLFLFKYLENFDRSREIRLILVKHLKKFNLNESEISHLKHLSVSL